MNDRFANSEAVVVASKPWPERAACGGHRSAMAGGIAP